MKFEHVSTQAAERMRDLADRARVVLVSAGIPAFDISSPDPRGGAEIDVDTGDDEAGGVYITWRVSRGLTEEISNYVLGHEHSHPRVQYSGQIHLAIRVSERV
jgi:hypothetical protein